MVQKVLHKTVQKALITLYVIIILAISGMAKASPILESVRFEPEYLKLSVSGHSFNVCDFVYKPHLLSIKGHGEVKVANIEIESVTRNEPCVQGVPHAVRFDADFDVRSLGLIAGQKYVVNIANKSVAPLGPIELELDKTAVELPAYGQIESGVIVALPNGQLALVREDQSHLILKSTVDMHSYIGQQVHVTGIILQYGVSPVTDAVSVDPLHQVDGEQTADFFVLGISSIQQD
jgi:hypothetical protein